MKRIILTSITIFIFQFVISQEKTGRPFITGDVNFTLGVNEDYQVNTDDDNGPLFTPSALLFRIGFGYEFKKRVAIAFNSGYDFHWNQDIRAFPTYGSLKYNITERDDDTHFIELRYGKMWTPSSNYPDGNYYGIGSGIQISKGDRWNTVFRIDFHRKKITGLKNDRLDSLSFGFGFTFY